MISWFQALSAIGVWKIKLIEKTRIEKEAYFAAERFFELIKKWGTIDYEEYWNRYSSNTTYASWHFLEPTGFWNFWRWGIVDTTTYGDDLYFCQSKSGTAMPQDGCLRDFNIWWGEIDIDRSGDVQVYGQYSYQFIDYNSDADTNWDEDNDSKIGNGDLDFIGDDDDLYLGIGPEAFPEWVDVGELYLINETRDERVYFRWNVQTDPDALAGAPCSGTKTMSWTGCLWTIQFLKLVGSDEWYDHGNDGWVFQGDGIIDTWRIHPDFTSDNSSPVAGSDWEEYWQDIFPETIHVSSVEFYLYPNKDSEYSWRDTSDNLKIAPYLGLKMILQPSWKEKKKIRWKVPSVDIVTTIQLLDFDLR